MYCRCLRKTQMPLKIIHCLGRAVCQVNLSFFVTQEQEFPSFSCLVLFHYLFALPSSSNFVPSLPFPLAHFGTVLFFCYRKERRRSCMFRCRESSFCVRKTGWYKLMGESICLISEDLIISHQF